MTKFISTESKIQSIMQNTIPNAKYSTHCKKQYPMQSTVHNVKDNTQCKSSFNDQRAHNSWLSVISRISMMSYNVPRNYLYLH